MANSKEFKNISYKEFENIINELKLAFEFETDMQNLSRKYLEAGVLYDYITTSSTYLASSVWTLLNKVFNFNEDDDLFSWWCIEAEFGTKFKVGDIEDTAFSKNSKFRKPDLSTTKNLYNYCVAYSKLINENKQ